MTTSLAELPSYALTFLGLIAVEPEGLTTSWMWEDGRRGFDGYAGDTYRDCSTRGLLAIRSDRFLLTDEGVALLGLPAYPAGDPSTWSEERAEIFFLKSHCHALAIALTRRHGYDLGVLVSGGLPLHVFALDTSGEPHDFDGRTTRERILGDCLVEKGTFLRLSGENDLVQFVGGHGKLAPIGEGDVAMATRYIAGRPDKFELRSSPRP